jgi:hypothetical protein
MKVHWALTLIPLLGMLALGSARAGEPSSPSGGTAPATTPAPAPASSTSGPTADEAAEQAAGELNRDILTVDQDVSRLKERVFRSKATLQLLKELVLNGSALGSKIVLWHENRMGSAYSLESIQYFLDGKNIYAKTDATGTLDSDREFQVLEQPISPGAHNLQVTFVLRGNGFGVFSYLKSYSFKVQSAYQFNIEDGRVSTVHVIANERGGPWRTFVDRPTVQYEANTERIQAGQ